MQESSIGIRVSVEYSTTTTAQQREGFDRVFGHYALGHPVELWSDLAPAAGAVCAVMRDANTGWLHAGADPRRDAYAIAW